MGIDRSGRASKRPNLFISRFPHHPVQRRPLLSAISTSTSTQPRTQNRFAHPSRPDGDPGLGTWPRRRRAVPFRLPACGCAPDLLPRDGHARSRCQPKGAVPVRLLYWQRGGPAEGSMTAGARHAAADQSLQKTLAGCVATTGRVRVGDVGVGSWPVACGQQQLLQPRGPAAGQPAGGPHVMDGRGSFFAAIAAAPCVRQPIAGSTEVPSGSAPTVPT